MPKKLKIFFVFLAAFAVVSVFSFFDVFTGVRSASFFESAKSLPPLETDSDKDGLTDSEESYWDTDFLNPDTDGDGFLDGEEVASRHDPNKPSPDDKLLAINLTQNMADLATAGLVEGSLKPDSPDYAESIDSVVLSVIDAGLESFVPVLDPSKIKTIDATRENQINYLNSSEKIWETFFQTYGSEIKNMGSELKATENEGAANENLIKFFNSRRVEFEIIAANWLYLPVPANWKEEHVKFLNLISKVIEINKALVQGSEDPIRATLAFILMTNLAEEIPIVVEAFETKAKSENLLSSGLFQ
ncbi:MAG: hypothetical protein Q8Q89_04220 [bacterium]|nr:hypothetical protein [bacterium]